MGFVPYRAATRSSGFYEFDSGVGRKTTVHPLSAVGRHSSTPHGRHPPRDIKRKEAIPWQDWLLR